MMRIGFAVAGLILVLDQASKAWMLYDVLDPPRVIPITGFFNLVVVWNRGVSFGLFSAESAWGPFVLSGLALAISVALVFWLRRVDHRPLAVAIGLVLGGAIGNVVDRVRFKAVFDFLDFHVFGYHWPAFNVADSAITVGVVLIVIDGLFENRRKPV